MLFLAAKRKCKHALTHTYMHMYITYLSIYNSKCVFVYVGLVHHSLTVALKWVFDIDYCFRSTLTTTPTPIKVATTITITLINVTTTITRTLIKVATTTIAA